MKRRTWTVFSRVKYSLRPNDLPESVLSRDRSAAFDFYFSGPSLARSHAACCFSRWKEGNLDPPFDFSHQGLAAIPFLV
jgi:hypothetical protein